ncbi:MAG: class I SAM-dependent methyltransferase, partial [Propionivibrio sp.]
MESTSFVTPEQSPRQKSIAAPAGVPGVLNELAATAGFRFNGDDPWDIEVIDPRLYQRVLTQGSLGFGEAYLDGWWECERLDELFHRLLAVDADQLVDRWARLRFAGAVLKNRLLNLQSSRRAFEVGEKHYDIGNDVFTTMLDPSMSYSCAYWLHAATLAEAQRDKLEMICRKLELQPGERLLD